MGQQRRQTPHYADWKAPAEDGGVLLWPDPPDLLRDTLENQKLLQSAGSTVLQNVPLPEVRRRMRALIGHEDDAAPLVAAGHQAELHHPGVWAKNALIDAAAAKLGGRAYHFAVDTDAPKHLKLRWPGGAEPLTDDPAATTAEWAALVDPPTPAHLRHLSEALRGGGAGVGLRAARAAVPRVAAAAVAGVAQAAGRADQRAARAGLVAGAAAPRDAAVAAVDVGAVPRCSCTTCWPAPRRSRPTTTRRSRSTAAATRSARPAGRCRTSSAPPTRARCRSGSTPWPPATRSRGSVVRTPTATCLRAPGGDDFRLDPAADGWAAAAALLRMAPPPRPAPRAAALTLTMCLRLLVADQFVHGIGGGQYDQVTDRLIARHFKLRPPRFCVTTATLYFPAAAGRARLCVPCVRQEGHRLRHRVLGGEKRQLVEAIAAAPRRSEQRAELFHEMHDRLAAAVATHPALRQWEQKVRETAEREQEERAVFDRELFYAIQPAERLQRMIERYRAAFE